MVLNENYPWSDFPEKFHDCFEREARVDSDRGWVDETAEINGC